MRVFQLLAAALLPLASLAAKKSSGDKFQDFRSKALSTSGPLRLDDTLYDELTKGQRDYSVAVLLTALEAKIGCTLCNQFQPDWDALGKQWMKGDKNGESRLVFGTLDFAHGRNTFQSLMLQTAPVLLLFQPTTGPHAKPDGTPLQYEFTTGASTAEPVHAWISRHLTDRPHPPFSRPVNYVKIGFGVTAVLGMITFGSITAQYILPLLQNRNLWAALSLIAVLLFTSGHMYNHIRGVPYVAGGPKGKITYFAEGFQSQFGMETQIVAATYAILAFATISLALKVPRMTNPQSQQTAVIAWSAVLLIAYSFLMSVFKFKNGGYPFWLPPF